MKLYITKPKHTAYGSIKMERYDSFERLLADCSIWFFKPFFLKPSICPFEQEFFWQGFSYPSNQESYIRYEFFPEGSVKEAIRDLVRQSLKPDLTETLSNRHHRWIGECDVVIREVQKDESSNFVLYFTKPDCVYSIQSRGIDRCSLWLHRPLLKRVYFLNSKEYSYRLQTLENASISGKVLRKHPELKSLFLNLWQEIVESFNFTARDMDEFYTTISEKNHKRGQSCLGFIREVPLVITLAGENF